MPKSWSKKTIRVTLTLGQGTFSGGGNTKIIQGLPVDVRVQKMGMPGMNQAEITILGMNRDDMGQLTRLAFRPLWSLRNSIVVEAGDEGGVLATVFRGAITAAGANFNQQPDIPFSIKAHTGAFGALIPSPPVSVQGAVRVDQLMQGFASELGMAYKNEGVTASVKNAVFNGSPLEKARKLAQQAGVSLIVDDDEIITLPKNKPRSGGVFVLTPETGLIGYPQFTDMGIQFKCLFNPFLRFGSLVQLKTILPRASGEWRMTKISHSLSAYRAKGGAWFSEVTCVYPSMFLGQEG